MGDRPSLINSIAVATLGHFAIQAAIFVAATRAVSLPPTSFIAYIVTSIVVHIGLGVFLAAMQKDFVVVESRRQLDRVNAANVITMFRISSVPTMLFFVFLSASHQTVPWLVGVAAASFVSDFVDGQLSRRAHQVTFIGRYLDSSSDYIVLFTTAIAFVYFDLIAPWFFWLLIARLGFQFVGMVFLFFYQGGHVEPTSSFLGKASVFATMVVFLVALLTLLEPITDIAVRVTLIGEIACAAIVIASIVDKAVLLRRDFHEARRKRQNS